jgi:tRNA uridine 5-carboxymethylaminomethyl modification enzyme
MNNNFDIIVVGGGHAGIEAAYIASQFNQLNIAILTIPGVGLGSAPCNPSVGGVGKGQVVRELDALGGLMGRLADLSGIQFRTLNDSKGYAVQSTRVQIDKEKYSQYAEQIIQSIANITVIREKVINIEFSRDNYKVFTTNNEYLTKKIIMTVGTFLDGKMHTGHTQTEGGRYQTESSRSLSAFFKKNNLVVARFKTGTPARLNKDTINYSVLEEQPSDPTVRNFHYAHDFNSRNLKQLSCYLARTNSTTMNIIRDNKEKSPMFNGQIRGVGARYCPSIEDKAFRYPDKNEHHVFIEPEGLEINTMYPSGISSSLPKEIQESFIKSINGLEDVKIEIYGYAVEYDVIDTTKLSKTLEHQEISGLYFAGQVNGTSGYEEAAAQGYIAGANAALSLLNKEALVLNRNNTYIGVLIEDLVSNLRDEPYRLFTARNENRLFVREDNTIIRIYNYRKQLGLNQNIDQYNEAMFDQHFDLLDALENFFVNPDDKVLVSIGTTIPRRMSLSDILKIATINPVESLATIFNHYLINVPRETILSLAISIKYSGYVDKANMQYQKVEKLDNKRISWTEICKSNNISFECKQRIERIKPETFGQLKLIEGIRPATLAIVASKAF